MPAVDVIDSHIAHTEAGTGDTTVVFLHGSPTSSYLRRGVIPHVAPLARRIAPDLVGMASGRPDVACRFADHARYLGAWFEALGLDHVRNRLERATGGASAGSRRPAAVARGYVDPRRTALATHPTSAAVADGARQLHELRDAAAVTGAAVVTRTGGDAPRRTCGSVRSAPNRRRGRPCR